MGDSPVPAPARVARSAAGRVLAAACTGLTIALASACAAAPDGGIVTSATMARGGQQDVYVQMISSAPQPGWDPETIVSGFLLASANFTGDHAIARKYLTRVGSQGLAAGIVGGRVRRHADCDNGLRSR